MLLDDKAPLDDFTTDERVMLADLPTEGIQTVYTLIGDTFAWPYVLGSVGLTVLAVKQRKDK